VSLTIQRAVPQELAECAALYDRVVREVFTWIEHEAPGAKFLAEAEKEEVYVAKQDGRIVGLASFFRPNNFLHSLYVDRDARGKGIGSALFAHIQYRADGPVSLKVDKLNHDAIAFYLARGLVIIDEGDPDAPGGGWLRMARPEP
jgi:GNAT superfamily N-acetyltransferase